MRALATKLYLFGFFDDFILIYPLYAVLFAESGLSVAQISILFFVWGGTAMVVSVPAGALADRVPRRGLLISAQLIRAAGYVVWIVEPTFVGFMVGFILWGTKEGLSDGAWEALIYDELDELGRTDEYVRLSGRTATAGMLAVVAASLGAAAAIEFGYDFVLWASVASVLAAGVVILSLPESARHKKVHEENYLQTLRAGVALAVRQGSILRIILFGGFIYAIWGGLDEYWSLYARDLGLSNSEIGLAMAGLYVAGAAGTLTADRFERLSTPALVNAMAALGLVLLGGLLIDAPVALLLVAVFMLGFCLIDILLGGRLQHAIEEQTRATVTSVAGVVTDVMGLGLYALLAILDGPLGLTGSLIAVAALIVAVALVARPTMGRWPARSDGSASQPSPKAKRARASSSSS
jgi:MFS family permease